LDYEIAPSYDVTVSVSDAAGATRDETFTINVGDVDDDNAAPSDLAAVNDQPVLDLNPVGYWRLADGAGADEIGGTDAIYQGATTSADDPFVNETTSAQFDGSGDYIEIPDDPAWQLGDGTVQLWFNPADVSGSQGLIERDASSQNTSGHIGLFLNGDDLVLRIQTTTESNSIRVPNSVTAGDWHHAAVSFGSNGLELYLNGDLVAEDSSFTTGIDGNNNPWVRQSLADFRRQQQRRQLILRGANRRCRDFRSTAFAEQHQPFSRSRNTKRKRCRRYVCRHGRRHRY